MTQELTVVVTGATGMHLSWPGSGLAHGVAALACLPE
jgi:hypothetical protein